MALDGDEIFKELLSIGFNFEVLCNYVFYSMSVAVLISELLINSVSTGVRILFYYYYFYKCGWLIFITVYSGPDREQ